MAKTIAIAIHGGAGTLLKKDLSSDLEKAYLSTLNNAIETGYKILQSGGSAVHAVEMAVSHMENSPLFNAGKGSVFNAAGKHEMDAAIMEGKFLKCGAVSGINHIKNPIGLARAIMDKSEHVYLISEGALDFARLNNIEFEDDHYFYDAKRYKQWEELKGSAVYNLDHTPEKKFGTVGAVAIDSEGNLAAATSTGGMTNKALGRVGDSPIIGAGTYANNKTCAVSCTGHGELFIRAVVAYDISCLMEYKGYSLKQACEIVVMDKLVKIGGEGGLVAIDSSGHIEMPFNSEGMYRGSIDLKGERHLAIYR